MTAEIRFAFPRFTRRSRSRGSRNSFFERFPVDQRRGVVVPNMGFLYIYRIYLSKTQKIHEIHHVHLKIQSRRWLKMLKISLWNASHGTWAFKKMMKIQDPSGAKRIMKVNWSTCILHVLYIYMYDVSKFGRCKIQLNISSIWSSTDAASGFKAMNGAVEVQNLHTSHTHQPTLTVTYWVVVSKIFYFHPENWGRFPFWLIFFRWAETTNQPIAYSHSVLLVFECYMCYSLIVVDEIWEYNSP